MLKKVSSGSENKRKLSRRDMYLALQKKLGAKINKDWATIPLNVSEVTKFGWQLGLVLEIYRSVFMRQAIWYVNTVKWNFLNDQKKFDSNKVRLKTKALPESDAFLDFLIKIQKKLAKETDPKKAASYLNNEIEKVPVEAGLAVGETRVFGA